MSRLVVVELWTGSKIVRRLRFDEADQIDYVNEMPDAAIVANLTRLGVEPMPATEIERRARLATGPLLSDLDAIATALVAANDGIRPTVRTVDKSVTWHPQSEDVAA